MKVAEHLINGAKLAAAAITGAAAFEVGSAGMRGVWADGRFIKNVVDDKLHPLYVKKGWKYYHVQRATGRVTKVKGNKTEAKMYAKAEKERQAKKAAKSGKAA